MLMANASPTPSHTPIPIPSMLSTTSLKGWGRGVLFQGVGGRQVKMENLFLLFLFSLSAAEMEKCVRKVHTHTHTQR